MGKPSLSRLKPVLPIATTIAPAPEILPAEAHPATETPSALDRRRFLGLGGKAVAFLAAFQALRPQDEAAAALGFSPFTYGVAAGDPEPTQVLLWTRVNASAAATPGSGLGKAVFGFYEVATDARFRQVVTRRNFVATAKTDHTVKVEARGLLPGREYFYRFSAFNVFSPVGRMRTTPDRADVPRSLRFGLVSCSNFEGGFFTAYRHLAERDDLDFIMHVGDYIYEYGAGQYGPEGFAGEVRVHDPAVELSSLADYRRRHACYKADGDLRSLHARYAFITTWDDHEIANDDWRDGAENHTPATEGPWERRKADAIRAYFEWMPVRDRRGTGAPGEVRRIYRKFSFGNLADLYMLDLRQYRDQQPPSQTDTATINDPARSITGDLQMTWLREELTHSDARWRFLGNSVMIAPVTLVPSLVPAQLQPLLAVFGLSPAIDTRTPINVDQWDGYQADRAELLGTVAGAFTGRPIKNVVFLTGDIHSSWACDLPGNPATYHPLLNNNSIATEFVCTSVTSDNINDIAGVPERAEVAPGVFVRNPVSPGVEQTLRAFNPWVQELEFDAHGFCVVDVTRLRVQVDYWFIRSASHPADSRVDPVAAAEFYKAYQTTDQSRKVTPALGALGPRV